MENQIILPDLILSPFSLGIGAGIIFLCLIVWVFVLLDRKKQQRKLIENLRSKNQILSDKLQKSQEDVVRLRTEKDSSYRQISQHKEDLEKMEEKFKVQFENLANRILNDNSSRFKQQSQESLGEILNPLKEKLMEFQRKVDDSFGKQANEQFSLKEQIQSIVEANEKITLQTKELTNALKSDSKIQGNWGEVSLERILEESGLRKGIDYTLQGKGLGMKHLETGQAQMPDVIVKLPEDKHIIIDAKFSFTDYERFCGEEDDVLRKLHLKKFIAAIRKQVKELEQRHYQGTDKLDTPDLVLMFMPLEGAYMLALQEDTELHGFAWNKGVALICHSTLFATLRTISSFWRLDMQNKNALEIARKGGALYDKVAGFVGDMQALGKNIKTIENTYDNAMNKLSEGRGSILRRTEELKSKGAKTSKSLPKELIEISDDRESHKENYG